MDNEFFSHTTLVAPIATQNVGGYYNNYYDSYMNADGEDEFFNAGGWKRMIKKQRARRDLRAKSKAQERITQAQAQKEAAKSMTAAAKSDAAIAKALSSSPSDKSKSNTTKIALIVGGVLVLGLVGFMVMRSRGK